MVKLKRLEVVLLAKYHIFYKGENLDEDSEEAQNLEKASAYCGKQDFKGT